MSAALYKFYAAKQDASRAMSAAQSSLNAFVFARAELEEDEKVARGVMRRTRRDAEALPRSGATDALCDCIDEPDASNFGALITELGRLLDAAIEAGVKVEDL